MFAAREASKMAIPTLSLFLVGAGFDIVSYARGRCSRRTLVTRLWRDFYSGVGVFCGLGFIGASWSVFSTRILPLFPLWSQSYVSMGMPAFANVLGPKLLLELFFHNFWSWDDDDEPLPSFSEGAALEHQRRYMRYGPFKSQFARPPELAPVAPEFIDPEMAADFVRECFPERASVAPVATDDASKQVDDDDSIADPATSLRKELNRARSRIANGTPTGSSPPSLLVTPVGSRYNSDAENSDTDSSDSESESDASSSASEASESDDESSAESESESASSSTEASSDDSSNEDSDEESD